MFEPELQNLGLSDKEAKVYVALLELGQGTVQEIAKKAGIPRPTAHLAIDELIKTGLASSHETKGKRVLFAEFPERLIRLLDTQERALKSKREEVSKILPHLKALYEQARERPHVRFFEGKEGLKAMQEDFLRTHPPFTLEISPRSEYESLFLREEREQYIARRKKRVSRGKALYTRKGGPITHTPGFEGKYLGENAGVQANISIYANKILIAVFRGKPIGIIIESKEIAETMRTLFGLAWSSKELE